jgi:tetratricopeptide (TPR) repeat protein
MKLLERFRAIPPRVEDFDGGRALLRAGDYAGAQAECEKALRRDPSNAGLQRALADVLVERGQYSRAMDLYQKALTANPANLQSSRRVALLQQAAPDDLPMDLVETSETQLARAATGDPRQAIEALQAALRIRPTWDEAYGRLGKALFMAGREEMAEQCLQTAIQNAEAVGRVYDAAYITLAELWAATRRSDQSIPMLEKLTAMAPSVDSWVEFGLQLGIHGQTDRAIDAMRQAQALAPGNARILAHLATVYQVAGRLPEAIRACDEAIAIDPGTIGAHTTRGMALMAQGHLREGFAEYEWRRRSPYWSKYLPPSQAPALENLDVAGRTILLYAEQGLGDTIMFARYAPQLAGMGAKVLLRAGEPLRRLMACLPGLEIVPLDAPLPTHDATIPVMSLPWLFGTDEASVPADTYIQADPAIADKWSRELASLGGLKAGVVWAGQPWFWNAHNRDMALADLAPLAALADVSLVSLQQGAEADDEATGLKLFRPGPLADFAETAGLIANLDIVITIDSAVAHLAGAMGKPVWLLAPHVAEWRWGQSSAASPWYPTMRIFRQIAPRDWQHPAGEVTQALRLASRVANS